jgi:hypothetical protein
LSRPREHHLPVTRTARYWTLGDPEGVAEVWFVLHGYKQLARRFLRRFEPIRRPGRLVVAPEGLSRFYVSGGGGRHGAESIVGASWMTREDRLVEIDDYVAYLDGLAERVLGDVVGAASVAGTTPAVVVLGFSQGVATACRWVTLGSGGARVGDHPDGVTWKPDRLLLWGDFLPPDLDMAWAERALEGVDVVLVRGSDDPALSPRLASEEAERLEASSLRPRRIDYEGGHEIHAETLTFLASGGS